MNNPLHAPYYADAAISQTAEVVENVPLARETFRLRFRAPEMARRILPGQFVMLRLADVNDPLIGRPLALYDLICDAAGKPECIDVVYLVKGKLTSRLQEYQPGQRVEVWGPLGNGFLPRKAEHLIMVAGGIGQTPFLTLAQEYLGRRRFGSPPRDVPTARRITFCYGARTADYLAGIEDFVQLGVDLQISTDDGSRGHRGFVTELLERVLAKEGISGAAGARIVCCGPEPMMEAVARIAAQAQIHCEVSLETPMACGVGICFTCVAKVRTTGDQWDYKRTCVEGPVFNAHSLLW